MNSPQTGIEIMEEWDKLYKDIINAFIKKINEGDIPAEHGAKGISMATTVYDHVNQQVGFMKKALDDVKSIAKAPVLH
jgi:hypothetical protein